MKELSFFLFILISFYFLSILFVPDFLMSRLIKLTAYLVVASAQLFGISSINKDGLVLVSGFLMRVNSECSAFYLLSIFVGAVIAYPKHSIKYKAIGVIAGTALIILLNAFRIMLLGFIGAKFPYLFEFIHTYIWEGMFTLLVVALWLIWVNRGYVAFPFAVSCIVGMLSAGLIIAGLNLIMESYLGLLAWTAGKLFEIVGNANSVLIYAEQDSIVYIHGGIQTLLGLYVSVFDSAIFFALILASSIYFRISSRIGQVVFCVFVLIIQHLVFVIVTGYFILQGGWGTITPNILRIVIRGVSLVTPVLLWIWVNGKEIRRVLISNPAKL